MVANDHEQMGAVLIGLEKSSYLINRCAAYERLYLNTQYETTQNLEDALTELYLAILKFLVEARKMCSKNIAGVAGGPCFDRVRQRNPAQTKRC